MSVTIALTRGNVLFASSMLKYFRFASTGLGGAMSVSLYKSDETPRMGRKPTGARRVEIPASRQPAGPVVPGARRAEVLPRLLVRPLLCGRVKHPSPYLVNYRTARP